MQKLLVSGEWQTQFSWLWVLLSVAWVGGGTPELPCCLCSKQAGFYPALIQKQPGWVSMIYLTHGSWLLEQLCLWKRVHYCHAVPEPSKYVHVTLCPSSPGLSWNTLRSVRRHTCRQHLYCVWDMMLFEEMNLKNNRKNLSVEFYLSSFASFCFFFFCLPDFSGQKSFSAL